MSFHDVWRQSQEYDPCEHGQDSRCLECKVVMLEQQAAQDEEAISEVQRLLLDVCAQAFGGIDGVFFTHDHISAYENAQRYLLAHGMITQEQCQYEA